MVLLIILVVLGLAIAWFCATHIPPPMGWLAALVVVLLLVLLLFSGTVHVH